MAQTVSLQEGRDLHRDSHPSLSTAVRGLGEVRESGRRDALMLFLASFLALYFELVVIRYLSTEVRVFAYLKNLPLIASFLGLGLGMALARSPRTLQRLFPLIAGVLFLLITYASALHLTHLPIPMSDYFVWTSFKSEASPTLSILRYHGIVLGIVALVVAFFVVLGGLVGERLSLLPPLRGYGINLAGGLAGILVYTLLAFLGSPPIAWVSLGLLAALPFFSRIAWGGFAAIVLAMAFPQPNISWSPYYRIAFQQLPSPAGWPHPSAFSLDVNHDYHQKMVDLSPSFLARYPNAEPNRSALPTYELPYRLVEAPGTVLIVGAGTGNDVAAALRHGVSHVDAVEIDPVILEIGRKYHPERPYASAKVTVHIDDARVYFKKANQKYDLIIFGYLDSHTLLSSFSSVRLDNYVYTLESFREARSLLREDGSVALSFGTGRYSFVTDRLFATLTEAFGIPPRVYCNGYDVNGVTFVEGAAREATPVTDLPEISGELQSRTKQTILATDRWPFLYLADRTIPRSIIFVLFFFVYGAVTLVEGTIGLPKLGDRASLHLFFLGAGFLLLETKAVTELALLFGSTWVVNSVVIGAFLAMALLANTAVMYWAVSRRAAYLALFALLAASLILPYSLLESLSAAGRVLAGGILAALPVFFSGLIFSRAFRDVAQPSRALGVNLLGAVVGGTLENTVMIGGLTILGALAILLYALSAVFIKNTRAPASGAGLAGTVGVRDPSSDQP